MYPELSPENLACKCGECDGPTVRESTRQRLYRLRDRYGKPLNITSAGRCPAHDEELRDGKSRGTHSLVLAAVDTKVWGDDAIRLLKLAIELGFTGFGVQQKGPHRTRFLHLDDATPEEYSNPRPWIWSY